MIEQQRPHRSVHGRVICSRLAYARHVQMGRNLMAPAPGAAARMGLALAVGACADVVASADHAARGPGMIGEANTGKIAEVVNQ